MKNFLGYFNTKFLKYPVEDKLLVLVPWLASIFTGLCTLEGYFLHDQLFIYACTISTLVFFLTYLMIRAKWNLKITAWIMVFNMLFLTNVVWFRFEGSHGTGPVMFLTLLFCTSIFFKKSNHGLNILIVIFNLFVLFYIEYQYPSLIKPYCSSQMRIIDLFFTYLICGLFMIFSFQTILNSYFSEKTKSEQVDKLKQAFLTNVSHELRTPMNAIVGFSQLMNHTGTSKEERKLYAGFVEDSCKSLTHIVDEIIEIAKLESNQVKIQKVRCNITDLLEHVYYQVNRSPEKLKRKTVKLILNKMVLKNDVIIETDPILLTQILLNIINNALKFTHKGFIKIGYNLRKTHLLFYIQDTGIGIPEYEHDLIFDSFTKANHNPGELYRGLGLGLTLSKRLINLLFGQIWVTSVIHQGSTFYFTLPFRTIEISQRNSATF